MLKVAVAGGSIGGLCAGVALQSAGHDVAIYERTSGAMHGRGAGIVVQPQLLDLLQRNRIQGLPTTFCRYRQYLVPGRKERYRTDMPMQLTSWQAIYRTLRQAFPERHYHAGIAVTGVRNGTASVLVNLDDKASVECDLLVCAEGSRSERRRRLLPDVQRGYAGYVAWRGTVEAGRVGAGLLEVFENAFTLCEGRSSGHILCYLIPGGNPRNEEDCRLLNWVWYVEVSEGPPLADLLTDRLGQRHEGSVPIGMVSEDQIADLHKRAARELHPLFTELVQRTAQPFIQAIFDVVVPQMAFGRICLLGDAAFVLRPHPGAATAKAAADAVALAQTLSDRASDIPQALQDWEARQLAYGRTLSNLAIAVGKRTVQQPSSSRSINDLSKRFDGVSPLILLTT